MLQTTAPRKSEGDDRARAEALLAEPAAAPPALLQVWRVALRWKWVIIGTVLLTLIAGLVATLLMTPRYTATTRLEISREQKKITNVEGLESGESGRDLEFYQTQYALLSARSLAERVSRSLKLSTNDQFFAATNVDPENAVFFSTGGMRLSAEDRARRERLAVEVLQKQLNISPIRGSALVDVSFTSASPELSAQIANAWASQFIQASMDRRFSSTADARKFLEGRLAELRGRVESSERELVAYASAKGIVALGRTKSADGRTEVDRTLVSSDLEALNQALAKATAERIQAQSRAGGSRVGGATADALGNQAIATLRQKRAEVAADYARLLVQFEPGYPAARALAEQIRVLDASIAREENRVQLSRTSELSEAARREAELRDKVATLKSELDRQSRDSIQYNIYQREADTNRELYDGLLQRYKEIGVAGIGANNIAIVDRADVPQKASSPRLLYNLAGSLLAGLVLAAILTFILDQIDEGLREPQQVSRLLQIPLLGSTPESNEDVLKLLSDAKSSLSEAYLSIRSNLAFSTDHGVPRSMMVTSSRPAEGKSTSSFALALVLGRTGKSVILIDGDMRSPSVHVFAALNNERGLSNFLAGDDYWRSMVQETSARGMSIMSAGPQPPSAAELLSSERMTDLVVELLEHYDHVIIDAPPILGLADAPLLARSVEGCICVIETGGVALRGIRASIERLRAVQAHILGAIVTKLPEKQAGYGYGYGYGYTYGAEEKSTA